MIIYKILNTFNDKCYIGQTIRPKKRFKQHLNEIKGKYHKNKHLQNAWHKYGEEFFVFEILEENVGSREELNYLESYYIKHFNSVENGYNKTFGGDCAKISESSRKLMSESAIKKFKNGFQCYRKGIKVSEEEKIELTKRIRNFYANNDHPMKGKKLSKDIVEKISGKNHYSYGVPSKLSVFAKKILATSPEGIQLCFYCLTEASYFTGADISNISYVCSGKRKTANKWKFEYV